MKTRANITKTVAAQILPKLKQIFYKTKLLKKILGALATVCVT